MKTKTGSNTNPFRAKVRWMGWLLTGCLATAIALYLAIILLQVPVLKEFVRPWWVKGEGEMDMIIFIALATVLMLAVFLMLRRLNRVEDRVRAPWINQENNGLYSLLHTVYGRLEKLEEKRKAKAVKRKGEKKS